MKFFDHKLGSKSYFYAGLIAEQPFFSKVRHSGGGLYPQLGGTESMPLMSLFGKDITYMGTVDFNSQLNQIQVPVSVKYHFIPNFSASASMNFGFNISEKLKTDGIFNGDTSQNYNGIKVLNLFPFLGAEYKINDRIFADVRIILILLTSK